MTGDSSSQENIVHHNPPEPSEFNNLPESVQEDVIDRYLKRLEDEFPAEEITRQYIKQTIRNNSEEYLCTDDGEEEVRVLIERLIKEAEDGNRVISQEDLSDIEERLMKIEDSVNTSTFLRPLWTYRQVIPYSIGLCFMIIGIKFSSISLALAGGALFIVTSLHYAN